MVHALDRWKTWPAALLALTACAAPPIDVDYFQPPITISAPPARPITQYSLYNNTALVRLGEMKAQVPAFNGKGLLMASWTPHPQGTRARPSFVVVHGGHGLVPTNFATGVWLRDTFSANVLVLDSLLESRPKRKLGHPYPIRRQHAGAGCDCRRQVVAR